MEGSERAGFAVGTASDPRMGASAAQRRSPLQRNLGTTRGLNEREQLTKCLSCRVDSRMPRICILGHFLKRPLAYFFLVYGIFLHLRTLN